MQDASMPFTRHLPIEVLRLVLLDTTSYSGFFTPEEVLQYETISPSFLEASRILWDWMFITPADRRRSLLRVFAGRRSLHLMLDMAPGRAGRRAALQAMVSHAVAAGRVRYLYIFDHQPGLHWLHSMSPFPGVETLGVDAECGGEDGHMFDMESAPQVRSLVLARIEPGNQPAPALRTLDIIAPSGPLLSREAFVSHLNAMPALRALKLLEWGLYDDLSRPEPEDPINPLGLGAEVDAGRPTWAVQDDEAFPTAPEVLLPELSTVKMAEVPHGTAYGILSRIDCPNLKHITMDTFVLLPNQPVPVHHPAFTGLLRQARSGSHGLQIEFDRVDHLRVREKGPSPRIDVAVGYASRLVYMMRPFLEAIHDAVADLDGELHLIWTGPFDDPPSPHTAPWAHPHRLPLPSATTISLLGWADKAFNTFPYLNDPTHFPQLRRVEVHPAGSVTPVEHLLEIVAPRLQGSRFLRAAQRLTVAYDACSTLEDPDEDALNAFPLACRVMSAFCDAFPGKVVLEEADGMRSGVVAVSW